MVPPITSVDHFWILDGNKDDYARYSSISAERLFRTEGAIAALSAHYWQKTLGGPRLAYGMFGENLQRFPGKKNTVVVAAAEVRHHLDVC